jgi:hypothetical protein
MSFMGCGDIGSGITGYLRYSGTDPSGPCSDHQAPFHCLRLIFLAVLKKGKFRLSLRVEDARMRISGHIENGVAGKQFRARTKTAILTALTVLRSFRKTLADQAAFYSHFGITGFIAARETSGLIGTDR